MIEIPANTLGNNLEVPFQVPLLHSNALEAEETFLILLRAMNENATVGGQACSTVHIRASIPPPDGKNG